MNYIDLFAGAGGLSEGFIQAGFTPIAHVEMDIHACSTLKTRVAYHYLKNNNLINIYDDYLNERISSEEFYLNIPSDILNSVINEKIDNSTIPGIFNRIVEIRKNKKIDLIIGGPPCQAYSLVGRSRDPHKMANDERNYLFKYYAKFLKKFRPGYFVFENVMGLLSASDYFEQMKNLFESKSLGYRISWKVLDSSQYGVLQKRRRVILIGKRGYTNFDFPWIETIINNWQIKSEIFSDLPVIPQGGGKKIMRYTSNGSNYLESFGLRNGSEYVTQHIARPNNKRDLSIYKIAIKKLLDNSERLKYPDLPKQLKTHKNQKSFIDRFKVIDPIGLSHTLVAHISKDGHHYIYPDPDQIRSISIREAARIQSFPDDFYFEGGQTAAFKQIGNAVPPLMAKNIANSIKQLE